MPRGRFHRMPAHSSEPTLMEKVGSTIYHDMNDFGKSMVDKIAKKTGYVSRSTREAMRKTDMAGKRGQLGAGWGE